MHEVVLCADAESLQNPAMLGLEGESLDSQDWLVSLSDAQEARGYARDNRDVGEVWVASSDDVDPINLAAALKRERDDMRVCLVTWQRGGSLLNRASAAGIDEVMGYPEMARRYATMKSLRRKENPRRRTPERVIAQARERIAEEARERAAEEGREDAVDKARDHVAVQPSERISEDAQSRSAREASEHRAKEACGDAVGDARMQDPESWDDDCIDAPLPSEMPVASKIPDGDSREDAPGEPSAVSPAPRRGYVLCVVSASGGTGKSTVAVLSALIAAGHGYRTAVIDADLQFGDVEGMLGPCDSIAVDQAIAHPALLDEARPRYACPMVISAPERMEHSELYLPQIPGLIDRARESFDVVVVNTGSFWTESHVQMMEVSTNTLFLMDQRPASVKAVRKALELCARCGVAANPFLFAVNRCTRKSLLTSLDISSALNGALVSELKEGGPIVAELTASGMAQKLVEDRNDLCLSINDFLGKVIPSALGAPAPEAAYRASAPKQKRRPKRKAFKKGGKAACL